MAGPKQDVCALIRWGGGKAFGFMLLTSLPRLSPNPARFSQSDRASGPVEVQCG